MDDADAMPGRFYATGIGFLVLSAGALAEGYIRANGHEVPLTNNIVAGAALYFGIATSVIGAAIKYKTNRMEVDRKVPQFQDPSVDELGEYFYFRDER